jgi:hypothetical protein
LEVWLSPCQAKFLHKTQPHQIFHVLEIMFLAGKTDLVGKTGHTKKNEEDATTKNSVAHPRRNTTIFKDSRFSESVGVILPAPSATKEKGA